MQIYLSIIITILAIFTVVGLREEKLFNPIFVFNSIWMLCFFLYSIELSSFYSSNVSQKAFATIILMIISFNFSYYFGQKLKVFENSNSVRLIRTNNKYLYIKRIFYVWILLTCFEILYFGNVPLVWLFLGSKENYASFGIPSVHGFVNSLSWFILNISFIYYLNTNDKRIIKIMLIINFVYLLLVARQSMITEIIQLVTIFAIKRKISIKRLIFLGILVILGFGILGNMRSGQMHILATSGLSYTSFSYYLMGFIWVYLYLMTPIANMINFVDSYHGYMLGAASLSKFLPTAVTNVLDLHKLDTTPFLVNETYNVSTSLVESYADFGNVGVMLFFMFLGIMTAQNWKMIKCHINNDLYICNYSVYLGILSLTFFANMLLTLPIAMQFVYSDLLFRNFFDYSRDQYGRGDSGFLRRERKIL